MAQGHGPGPGPVSKPPARPDCNLKANDDDRTDSATSEPEPSAADGAAVNTIFKVSDSVKPGAAGSR